MGGIPAGTSWRSASHPAPDAFVGRCPGRFRADSMIRVLTMPGHSTETLTLAPYGRRERPGLSAASRFLLGDRPYLSILLRLTSQTAYRCAGDERVVSDFSRGSRGGTPPGFWTTTASVLLQVIEMNGDAKDTPVDQGVDHVDHPWPCMANWNLRWQRVCVTFATNKRTSSVSV